MYVYYNLPKVRHTGTSLLVRLLEIASRISFYILRLLVHSRVQAQQIVPGLIP